MLENIKSLYYEKIIFIHVEEKLKLNLIKYNKSLQQIMNISIINYKLLSKRYIIYEANRKGKEYNSYNDELIYEGGYLKGTRNGIGKEYYFNDVIFEGEYKNGKKNGKGKEYYYSGEIKFEGEYLNGKKWKGKEYNQYTNEFSEIINGNGFMKEYSKKGKLIFEGEYINGEKNGKGKEYYNDGIIHFDGEYSKGKRNGNGKEFNRYGKLVFEGEFLYDKKWNGNGFDNEGNIIYRIKNGKGFVKETYFGKQIFEGDYIDGERNGKGKIYDNMILIFEGEFLKGKKNGKGKEFNKNRNIKYEGEYLYDYKLKGKEYIKGKLEFEGEYLFDKKWNGKGYDQFGNIMYELNNGNGNIKEYDCNDELVFEGLYLNGEKKGNKFLNFI